VVDAARFRVIPELRATAAFQAPLARTIVDVLHGLPQPVATHRTARPSESCEATPSHLCSERLASRRPGGRQALGRFRFNRMARWNSEAVGRV
jgi:hypothetical protein